MSRLTSIQTNGASSELRRSLKNSRLKLDEAPRFLQIMANSPASLRAYIRADAALVRGQLTPRQRQQVALAVAEINGSSYSLSAHYDAGKGLGLTHQEMQLARNAAAADPKADTMLRFTRAVVLQRGDISDEDFQALGKAGFTDAQIIEIVANIALNIFSNYFSSVARTEVDFPLLEPGTDVPRAGIAQSETRPARLRARSTKPHIKFKMTVAARTVGGQARRPQTVLNVIKPQSQDATARHKPVLATTGRGTARDRANDPMAVGIEESKWPFRFARARLLVSRKPNRKQKCK